jgi:cell division septal protein FtsQ
MRRPGRFVGWIVFALLIGWGLSWAVPRAPEWFARLDWFPVRTVRVEGVHFLTEEEVRTVAAVAEDAHLWDDVEPVAERVATNPLVKDVTVKRRLPGTLVVRVEERQPVALVPTPTLEPVDVDGELLPLDPALHRLDLPVIRASRVAGNPPPAPAIAAAARESARLAQQDPGFWEGVSEVTEQGSRDVTIEWARKDAPPIRLRFTAPLAQARLREALAVLHDLSGRGGPAPVLLDLRFADQVVVRWSESG